MYSNKDDYGIYNLEDVLLSDAEIGRLQFKSRNPAGDFIGPHKNLPMSTKAILKMVRNYCCVFAPEPYSMANAINQQKLDELEADAYFYEGTVSGAFESRNLPTHETLELKKKGFKSNRYAMLVFFASCCQVTERVQPWPIH